MTRQNCFWTVSIFLGLSAFASGQVCPSEWTYYEGSCYNLGTELLTWADAQEVCRIFDSDLVVLESQEENSFMKRFLSEHHTTSQNSASRVWIGATDVFNEGHFMWLRTFENVDYADWNTGEPNHNHGTNSEDCVQLRHEHNWQWNDESCARTCYFVCELELNTGDIIG